MWSFPFSGKDSEAGKDGLSQKEAEGYVLTSAVM
jgi:hypothetical protein